MSNRSNRENKLSSLIPKANMPQDFVHESKIFPKQSQDEVERLNKEKIFFSFQFLDTQHEAFNCGETNNGWFLHLFDNLSELSKLTFTELEKQRQHYDMHRHDFNKTEYHYIDNHRLNEEILSQISPENMIQFRLSTGGGRVHGIRYHNKIYIIWLDPHHNMNPDERFGGSKFFEAPLTPYQELLLELDSRNEELRKKKQEFEDLYELWSDSV
ncbi:hypothetical protein V7128_05590 [Neobacillus vireti]|uniref:hypothetical protein n=1 Tax=Neobacillus vireti TaxID=220686 RepID=UPI002FFE800F